LVGGQSREERRGEERRGEERRGEEEGVWVDRQVDGWMCTHAHAYTTST
jgi:hypothetical protein